MPDTLLPKPDPLAFNQLMRTQAAALRANDEPTADVKAWEARRRKLHAAVMDAAGGFPRETCPLEPQVLGVLKRSGYSIEKLVFQSRPDVWVTANAYVSDKSDKKRPAVLVVHGHWPWARIDPVVQARCLGLVKLGFFVLAVDAFGSGERYTAPARGTYHGALYGSTLWPTGLSLLGLCAYDNRRAVDYLRSRPEVDGDRLGITGASGGGNQTMYAGALDDRFRAVVPVCSVGTYQSYLQTACCVCEMLPGALRFAEVGDVLSLVAPRALLVISASQDGIQFSPGEAKKSVSRAQHVFQLLGAADKLRHSVFESPHAYNQPMRELMYGWMTRWLKDEGDGQAIAEPKHDIEKPEDLRCYPDNVRPKAFRFPPALAGREGARLLAPFAERPPAHVEAWEAQAVFLRERLRKHVLGDFPRSPETPAAPGKTETVDGIRTTPVVLTPEPGMPLPALLKDKGGEKLPACLLLHLEGKTAALAHPLAAVLLDRGWAVLAPDLRATGETKPSGGALLGAPDHHSAEHAIWIGRPLLGQWVFDVRCLLEWLGQQPNVDKQRLAVVGIGQAGVIAVCAAGLFHERVASAAAVAAPSTFVTDEAYPPGTSMGLLAPGILRLGDVPHLAALAAPRRLMLANALSSQGKPLTGKALDGAFDFTRRVFGLYKAEAKLTAADGLDAAALAKAL
jgi:dienelactone hydrolase